MDQGLIPGRYAKALYLVAKEKGDSEKLYQMMRKLSDAFAAEPKLNETMTNPFVADSDKTGLIFSACDAGCDNALLADFVKLLEKNHRMAMVREIASAYQKIYREDNNIYRVKVTSAAPMQPDVEDRLKKLILAHLKGATMEYQSDVDPDLIGGFVVNIDNQRLDASVNNQLKQLRLNLLSNY